MLGTIHPKIVLIVVAQSGFPVNVEFTEVRAQAAPV
jgi:hypothetical protein